MEKWQIIRFQVDYYFSDFYLCTNSEMREAVTNNPMGIPLAELVKYPELSRLVNGNEQFLELILDKHIDFRDSFAFYDKRNRLVLRNPRIPFVYRENYVARRKNRCVVVSGFPPDTDVFELVKWASEFEACVHWPYVLPVDQEPFTKAIIMFQNAPTVDYVLRLSAAETEFNGISLKMLPFHRSYLPTSEPDLNKRGKIKLINYYLDYLFSDFNLCTDSEMYEKIKQNPLGIAISEVMNFPEIRKMNLLESFLKLALESIDFTQSHAWYVRKSNTVCRNPSKSFTKMENYISYWADYNVIASGFPPIADLFTIVKWASQFERSVHWPYVMPIQPDPITKKFTRAILMFWSEKTVVNVLRLSNERRTRFGESYIRMIRYTDNFQNVDPVPVTPPDTPARLPPGPSTSATSYPSPPLRPVSTRPITGSKLEF